MIISRKHRYLFVEVPHTGSSAISRELRQFYDGERILYKHATFAEFRQVATREERQFLIFAGVRHPLDVAVTEYFKVKTNHHGRFTNPRKQGTLSVTRRHVQKYEFVSRTKATFAEYFKTFNTSLYNNYYLLMHSHYRYIIRFEHLQDDFNVVLEAVGLSPVRPLPTVNPTAERKRDFWSYYTPDLHDQARRVYGPYMKKWGYDFPPAWGRSSVPLLSCLQFQSTDYLTHLAATYLGFGPHSRGPITDFAKALVRKRWF